MQRRRNQQRNQEERRKWACDIKKRKNGRDLCEISFAVLYFSFFCVFRCYKMGCYAVFMLIHKKLNRMIVQGIVRQLQ